IICFFRLFALSPLVYFTLSLHDALPIYIQLYVFWMKLFSFYRNLLPAYWLCPAVKEDKQRNKQKTDGNNEGEKDSKSVNKVRKSDRKSTRLNSSHVSISYAVFCLKKKKR